MLNRKTKNHSKPLITTSGSQSAMFDNGEVNAICNFTKVQKCNARLGLLHLLYDIEII